MRKKLVVDLDGTLLDTHSALESRVKEKFPNFRMSLVKTYDFNRGMDGHFNGLNACRDYILSELVNPALYSSVKLAEGYEGLYELSEDMDIIFHTVSVSEDIAVAKYDLIRESFNGLRYEFRSEVSRTHEKGYIKDADFVIEDCPYNFDPYKIIGATCILLNKPFNQVRHNPDLGKILQGVLRVDSLSSALSTVRDMIDGRAKSGYAI